MCLKIFVIFAFCALKYLTVVHYFMSRCVRFVGGYYCVLFVCLVIVVSFVGNCCYLQFVV
jgi:hypothetical protein